MSGLAGAIAWAVVPFAPAAPFRLYAGEDRAPIEVPEATKLIEAARRGAGAQFTYLVPGKVRPVLILSDRHDRSLAEYLALRLARFSKLEPAEQERVRAQQSRTLFHLRPDEFPDLPEENAAMIAGLVRVHRSAVDPTPLGRLDAQDLAVVHQRVTRFYGFDLRMLVHEQLRTLAERQRQQKSD